MAEPDQQQAGYITLEQACRLVMLSNERIRQLVRDGYIPKPAKNSYPLVGVVQGYIRFLRDEDRRSSKVASESGLKQARQAEIEMRMAERRRDLVARPDAEAAMDDVVGQINQEFSGFAARVTRDPGMRRQIETKLDEVINSIADTLAGSKRTLATGGADAAPEAEDNA
jgi:hypothetical protein